MSRLQVQRLGIAAMLLVLIGCARDHRPAQPQPQIGRRAPPATAPVRPVAAATYVANAASMDLLIIRSSELALQRTSMQRVRDFASMMVAAHQGTGAQLSFAGRRLNLLPSATLQTKHQMMLDELQRAADFDAVYRRQQRALHDEAVALHTSYAAAGASPTLRPVASAYVPVIQRHMRLLKYL